MQGPVAIILISLNVIFIWETGYWTRASKNDADEAVSVVFLTSSYGGYINGRNSANLELLIDKTSSIYLYVKLKATAWQIKNPLKRNNSQSFQS
jgi:hypothetical protein